MAVESKPSPPAAIQVPKEFPLDMPHEESEAVDYAASMDKWWTDTRTVLLRQSEIISDLANAIRNQQTGDLTTLSSLISALTLRVDALESAGRGLIVDADVAGDASIREFKLELLYPTHSNENDPTAGEKQALAGTTGTPSDTNRYVTDQDTRLGGGVTGFPTGCIIPFGGSVAPTGFLLCDGSNVSRTAYARLFAVIGTAFGVGDGTTTFGLPNQQRRTMVGAGGAGTAQLGNAVGNTGGAETVMLAGVNIPNLEIDKAILVSQAGAAATPYYMVADQMASGSTFSMDGGDALDPRSGAAQTAHANLPPSLVVNFIIKT